MDALLGPPDTPLRRLRGFIAFVLAVLLVVGVLAAVLGNWLPLLWGLLLAAVFVGGHLWSWPRRDGRIDPDAAFTPTTRAAVASALAVGTASGFAVVLQGGGAAQALVQSLVTAAIVLPVLLLLNRWQQRRTRA